MVEKARLSLYSAAANHPTVRSLFAGDADLRLGASTENSDYNSDQVAALV